MKADLYETLGVGRDATPDEIKKAHRAGVKKHHPDRGGERETFEQVQRAFLVLHDPEKRQRYDETGDDASASSVDQTQSEVARLVIGAFDRALTELQGNFKRRNVVAKMKALLSADRKRGDEANLMIAKGKAQMEEMRTRLGFTGDGDQTNIIDSALLSRIREADDQQRLNNEMMERVDQAIKHVELYGWEVDPEPEMKPFSGAGSYNQGILDEIMKMNVGKNFSTGGFFTNTGA